ncbi:hypothetical protein LV89_01093 [Arcicella aurantiaca]|uniref:Uncharacterized protein n=1 Tax=Arcicella aurantiaca TaxID=591202 RepID=A0A316EYD4_9BACT|nr:hypothetical protein [Arcicella aurantiaca]PWK28310.1 hypothetical protein LV89_01093 [Arcicella aurantiaca]
MKSLRTLKIVSILYLLIPSILFLLTWVHLWISIPCVLFISFYTWKTVFQQGIQAPINTLTLQNIVLSIFLSIVLNFVLGIGEFRPQTYDFQANNFKYYDLITNDLPVYYAKQQTYLCYYTGYYLPSALLAKVFGLATCRYISFIWSVLGLSLVFTWITTFTPKNAFSILLVVVVFSNTWIAVKLLMNVEFFQEYLQPYYFQLNQFKLITQSFVKNYAWATQHTLPACLGACMIIEEFRKKQSESDLKYLLLMLLSTMFWSPLTTIGLFPFVAISFLINFKNVFSATKRKDLGLMFLLTISFIPLILYFISTEGVHANNTEFIWQTGVSWWLFFYLLYAFSNFIGWGILLRLYENTPKLLWIIAVFFPCLIAIYRIGIYNDFNIRVSFPSFFMLSILVGISVIERLNWKSVSGGIILFVLFFNSLSNINQLEKGIFPAKILTTIEKPFIFKATNMLEFQRVAYGDESAVLEYSLKKDSVFERYFLKK